MDSFELNKIMGAVLATCLTLLVTNFAANAIFSPGDLIVAELTPYDFDQARILGFTE